MTNVIYLLPEIINDENNPIFPMAHLDSPTPVTIPGFKLYTFLNRLDKPGYSIYCVAIENPRKTCLMYKYRFDEDIPDFEALGFLTTLTHKGFVVHIAQSTFDMLDSKDIAVSVKSGDWESEKDNFNQITAMYSLGAIPYLSPAIFNEKELFSVWKNRLHQIYGTYGDLTDSLNTILSRIAFAINFFCIQYEGVPQYVSFTPLRDGLKDSMEISAIRNIIPSCTDVDEPLIVIYVALKITFDLLNRLGYDISSLDDSESFTAAIMSFQERVNIQVGLCDPKTLRTLISVSDVKHFAQLPILKMAGIEIKTTREPDFPLIQPLEQTSSDPISEKVRKAINRAIVSMPDPVAKIEWMNKEIGETFSEYNNQCKTLSVRVDQIENTILEVSRQLKDVIDESKNAAVRVENAAKLLNDVHTAHSKIQGKFDLLREKLFAEQSTTRLTLIMTIVLTLIGAFTLKI